MTADVEMLPCPWCGEKLASVSVSEGSTSRWRKVDGCCADGPEVRHNTMADDQEAAEAESRAAAIAAWNTRANVAHATAAKDAEIADLMECNRSLMDALNVAELSNEALRAEVEMLRDAFSDEDMTAGAHWFGRYVEQKRKAEQLAEEVEALRAEAERSERYAEQSERERLWAEACAERLAEALREWWSAHRPVGWTEDQHRACPYVNLPTDTDKALAEALLRDQEEGQ